MELVEPGVVHVPAIEGQDAVRFESQGRACWMSWVRPVVTRTNEGTWPSWSRRVWSLIAPFERRDFAQGKTLRHNDTVLASKE